MAPMCSVASPAAPAILKILLQAFLTPQPNVVLSTSRWHTYSLLAYKISGAPAEASGQAPQTILDKLEAETKKILRQYPAEYVSKQMTESVRCPQSDNSLQEFYYVVKRFLMIGQGLQANLLRYGKLHIPMANAWWGVGRVATLQIRPDNVSAAFSWDPLALRAIDECVFGGSELTGN